MIEGGALGRSRSARPRSRRARIPGGLAGLAVRRLVGSAVTLLLVSVVVFVATELLPGDAVRQSLGREATPQAIAALEQQLGTDRPPVARYVDWLGGVVRLDFGDSLSAGVGTSAGGRGTPVSRLIATPLANSAVLVACVLALLVPLSLLLGAAMALREGSRADRVAQSLTLALGAMPEFVVGVLLVALFALWLDLLPAVSLTVTPRELVLPVMTLVLTSLAWTARLVRAGVIDVLAADYVTMARLKGLDERRVVVAHVVPNAVGPALQAFALTTGYLAGGVVVVEYLFSFPGVAQGLVSAVQTRDVPVVEAYTLVIAAVYVAANLGADLLAALFNPRLRDG